MIPSEVWDPIIWSVISIGIPLLAMILSVDCSPTAVRETRKQVRLQRFQAWQELRNHASAWADEVVANLQGSITQCFIYERNPDNAVASLQSTRLAGNMSELIDRGRWNFENDKASGFGEWKEGAYQGLAPEAIHVMKQAHKLLAAAAVNPSDTPYDCIGLRPPALRTERVRCRLPAGARGQCRSWSASASVCPSIRQTPSRS